MLKFKAPMNISCIPRTLDLSFEFNLLIKTRYEFHLRVVPKNSPSLDQGKKKKKIPPRPNRYRVSTDLRVFAYQRQLTPVAIYLSKPDVIRNQIANSPPPRCQPLLRAIRPRYRVRVQATFQRRPTPSILSAEHARFPATNLFLKELLNLKSTPFRQYLRLKIQRDRDAG